MMKFTRKSLEDEGHTLVPFNTVSFKKLRDSYVKLLMSGAKFDLEGE